MRPPASPTGRPVLFRVDGGNVYSLALGHTYRMIRLAETLQERGFHPYFLMKDFPGGPKKVRDAGFPVRTIDPHMPENEDLDLCLSFSGGDILVIDTRHYSVEQIAAARHACRLLVLFYDFCDKPYRPHVLVNPSVLPAHRAYSPLFSDVTYCLGPEYFLLGRTLAVPRDNVAEGVSIIAISLGGADPSGYGLRLLPILALLPENTLFEFVIGAAYNQGEALFALRDELRLVERLHILRDVPDLPFVFSRADAAMVAGGGTALELAWTGTPGILVPTIGYEGEVAEYLQQRGVFMNLGDIKQRPDCDVAADIARFLDAPSALYEQSRRSRALIDGKGRSRLADIIEFAAAQPSRQPVQTAG